MISRWSRINNRAYWSLVVVMAGVALIGGTVYNLRQRQHRFTSAAGSLALSADERALSWSVRPLGEQVEIKLELNSFDRSIELVRVALMFDPQTVEYISAKPGYLFDQVQINPLADRVVLVSQGNFYGQGTWVKLRFRPLTADAQVRIDPQVSILQYEDGESRTVAEISLPLRE